MLGVGPGGSKRISTGNSGRLPGHLDEVEVAADAPRHPSQAEAPRRRSAEGCWSVPSARCAASTSPSSPTSSPLSRWDAATAGPSCTVQTFWQLCC